MKKKWALLGIITLGMFIIIIGCQRRESTKEEVYKEFQDKISTMNYYRCIADVEVVGNKTPSKYSLIHTYKKPDNYKLEVVYPENLKGKSMEYRNDKILIKDKSIKDTVELPNIGKNNQYLFIGDFIKNYLQNEGVDIRLSKGKLVLSTDIPGENKYFSKQILYVDIKAKNPEKMEIVDDKGISRFIVNYREFDYKN